MPAEKRKDGSSLQLHGQVVIDDTVNGTLVLGNPQWSRADITLLNTDANNTVYIGNKNLTSANGFPVIPGSSITRKFRGEVWAITDSGLTATLAYISSEDY